MLDWSPGWLRGACPVKTKSTLSGLPISRFSASSASKKPRAARCIKDHGARDLNLARRQFPPITGTLVVARQGQGQDCHPPIEEILEIAGRELVTVRLECVGVLTACEAVGERGEADPGFFGLPLRSSPQGTLRSSNRCRWHRVRREQRVRTADPGFQDVYKQHPANG